MIINWASFALGFGSAFVFAAITGIALYLWVTYIFSRING